MNIETIDEINEEEEVENCMILQKPMTQPLQQKQTFIEKANLQFQNDAQYQQNPNKQSPMMHAFSVPMKYNSLMKSPNIQYQQFIVPSGNIQKFINYADDESLPQQLSKELQAQQLEMAKVRQYKIQKGVHVSSSTLYKSMQLSNWTTETIIQAQISIYTDNQRHLNCNQQDQTERDGIDLICVLDTSGSMEGQKLQNLKKTLKYLLTIMNKNDRLCLISFSQTAVRLNALRCMTDACKHELTTTVINNLQADGGTCIAAGMTLSFEVLNQRRYKNQVTSVFLLSDGLDDNAELRVKEAVLASQIDESISINCFGFGADHDAKMMREIAKLRNGNFYFVDKLDMLDDYFVDAFGGLVSVVAQNIKIDIQLSKEKLLYHPCQAMFQNMSIQKVYGDGFRQQSNGGYEINLLNILEGVKKDFILEISVPYSPQFQQYLLQDHEKNVPLLDITLRAESIDKKQALVKSTNLFLNCINEGEKLNCEDDEGINEDVLQNVFRVKGAEAIEKAMELAEANQHQKGQDLLMKEIREIKQHPNLLKQQQCGMIQMLLEDLQQAHDNCAKQSFEHTGKSYMTSIQHSHSNQMNVPSPFRSAVLQKTYSSPIQREMSASLQAHKFNIQK